MPTYVYKCATCEEEWEESLKYEDRDMPVEVGCVATAPCSGSVWRVPQAPGFAYDNIPSKGHPHKTPDWLTDKFKEIKKQQPGADFTIPG